MMSLARLGLGLLGSCSLLALACTNTPTKSDDPNDPGAGATTCTEDAECGEGERCNVPTGECVAYTGGSEIGTGDGSPESVTFTVMYTASPKTELIDLEFHPSREGEVWALSYSDDSVHIGTGVLDEDGGSWKSYIDPAARHFMHKPTAIAMGADGLWATCGDNDNSQNDPRLEPNYFMGPALFTTDMSIFAKQTPDGLGSHVDMLHNTTYCRGIAHVTANVYWTFNAELGSLEKYDFNEPHEPGGDDHSDGEIYRYVEGQVKGVDEIPSHLFYDPEDEFLYIADTGNQRIVRLDTTKGKKGGRLPRRNEVLKASAVMTGVDVEEVVPAGTLEQPSGLEIRGGLIYVTDAARSTFHVFDKEGNEIRSLETGLPAKSLAGFTFAPDGKVWFADRKKGRIVRIDP